MRVIGEQVFIYGMIEKNSVYYILREKENHYYAAKEGDVVYDIMEAAWFLSYGDAKRELETYDNPEEWDIIRMSCLVKLEEIM